MKISSVLVVLPLLVALAAPATLAVLAGCNPRADRGHRAQRTGDVTLHLLSQSSVQGEVIPCG